MFEPEPNILNLNIWFVFVFTICSNRTLMCRFPGSGSVPWPPNTNRTEPWPVYECLLCLLCKHSPAEEACSEPTLEPENWAEFGSVDDVILLYLEMFLIM